jgi:hypothetical protein
MHDLSNLSPPACFLETPLGSVISCLTEFFYTRNEHVTVMTLERKTLPDPHPAVP